MKIYSMANIIEILAIFIFFPFAMSIAKHLFSLRYHKNLDELISWQKYSRHSLILSVIILIINYIPNNIGYMHFKYFIIMYLFDIIICYLLLNYYSYLYKNKL